MDQKPILLFLLVAIHLGMWIYYLSIWLSFITILFDFQTYRRSQNTPYMIDALTMSLILKVRVIILRSHFFMIHSPKVLFGVQLPLPIRSKVLGMKMERAKVFGTNLCMMAKDILITTTPEMLHATGNFIL